MSSARLPTASVQNRLFPKTRSWIALGFPVELLSPLAVLRILFAMLTVVWPALALGFASSSGTRISILAVSAVAGMVWLGLMRIRGIGTVRCQALLALAIVAPAVVGRSSHDDAISVIYLAFAAPVGAAGGLFLRTRHLVGLHALVAGALYWTVAPYAGVAVAVAVGVGGSIALMGASGTVALLSRAINRRNEVDADTGLPNGFGLALAVEAGDTWDTYVVVSLSLTALLDVREALGYQVGTELLRRAVEDLGQVLPAGAVLGRVDGDELVALVPLPVPAERRQSNTRVARPTEVDFGHTDALVAAVDTGQRVAAELADAVSAGHYLVGDIEISLRACAGVAIAPWDGDEVAALVRRASLSARRAVAGGQRVRVWDGERDTMTADDLALLAELRLDLDRGGLWLAYQPQLDARTGRNVSVESLLRWDSPTRGPVPPDRFIPLAERTGLIDRLTDWVLDEALDAQVRWQAQGITLPVSVNVSAKSLSRPDLPEWVLAKLQARSLTPSCLTLEVTETAEAADLLQAIQHLQPLRQHGVRLSIDDFGTGYTSLSVLPHLPLDELKVDQGFVKRSGTSPADEAIVRSICELAHRLGLIAVAEGVEDDECSTRLRRYNFDLLQGYHLSRPLRESDLLAYLRASPSPTTASSPGVRSGGHG